jgi:hypothetical protein
VAANSRGIQTFAVILLSDSTRDFRREVERSKDHLDLVLFSVGVLSTYQNVWKPKYESARTEEEKQAALSDLAMIRAKLRAIDEVETLLFPDQANWFKEWKAKRKAEGNLEMVYDY